MRGVHKYFKRRYLQYIVLSVLIFSVVVNGQTENKPVFSFGVIADIQYCECETAGTRFYSNSLKKLWESVRDFNTGDMSFVIQLGDLIDKDFESYDSVLSLYNKIKAKKYHVLGNHDFNVGDEKKQNVPKIIDMDSRYYDFVLNGWRMIVLDGNELSFYESAESLNHREETEALFQQIKDSGAINAHDWNGGLGSQQISWVEGTLKQASISGEKVLLFCHFPVFPSREENLWNDIELITLIESYPCVKGFFSGHYHPGSYAKKRGIHYLSLQGMVETEDQNAYSIVEVYSDHLKVVGYGRESSRILTFNEGKAQNEK